MKQAFYCLDSLSAHPDTSSSCALNSNLMYIAEPNNLILNYTVNSNATIDIFLSSILNPTTLSYCSKTQET